MRFPKYKIKEFDVVNDIWILQRKFWGFLYENIGVGSKAKLESKIKELNEIQKGG